ncbi:sulfotransferase family 2 domain-containing protein [Isoptericola sp. NPDC060257]|uniref:sulfotransferase family 2 domain-containing protein n=1 Tax=Isoptericola sp. NPDC060257 TaxID=3347087 RepID=UPI0036639306
MAVTGTVPLTAEHATAPNTWVLPEHKVLFTHLAKNACTSLKWLVAELSGQDPEQFTSVLSCEATPRMMIHHRRLWHDVRSLKQLEPAERAEISPANGWFVFAVVRDPRLRAFSAWQSKFLVGDPVYTGRKFAGAEWLPDAPGSVEDVVRDFARFVEVLRDPRGPVRDTHFAPQTTRLHEDTIPYSRIYDISDISTLLGDLSAHLDDVGRPHEVSLGRENDTPLRAASEVFEGGVREALEEIYGADLARFGDRWDFDPVMQKPAQWSASDFRDIAARRSLGERITTLYGIAKDERAAIKDLEQEKAGLVRANRDLERSLARATRTPLRRAASKAKRMMTRSGD